MLYSLVRKSYSQEIVWIAMFWLFLFSLSYLPTDILDLTFRIALTPHDIQTPSNFSGLQILTIMQFGFSIVIFFFLRSELGQVFKLLWVVVALAMLLNEYPALLDNVIFLSFLGGIQLLYLSHIRGRRIG